MKKTIKLSENDIGKYSEDLYISLRYIIERIRKVNTEPKEDFNDPNGKTFFYNNQDVESELQKIEKEYGLTKDHETR